MAESLQTLWLALGFRPVFLWSDSLIYLLLVCGGVWLRVALRREYWQVALRQVMAKRMAMFSFGLLCLYGTIGLLDTVHYRLITADNPHGSSIHSVLDRVCQPLTAATEKTLFGPVCHPSVQQRNRANAPRADTRLSPSSACRQSSA